MGAAAAAVVAGAAASVVAVMPGLLAAEDAVVASVVVAGAAAAVAAGSMPSGSVISRPPAADLGEGAACAKSHDLTARPSRLRTKTSKAHLAVSPLGVASGFVIGKCCRRHRAVELLKFVKEIDAQVHEGLDVHNVMDNYAAHKDTQDQIVDLAAGLTIMSIFTPTSALWINQVERWFAELTRKQIQRALIPPSGSWRRTFATFVDLHSRNPKPLK